MAAPILRPTGFYVYLHRKATTGEVFYVGKGHGKRAWSSLNRNEHWRNVVAKHGLRVELVEVGLQEWAAFELESNLIALYGRKDLGFGPLVNWTDGGEGASEISEQTRKKKRLAGLGRKHSIETKVKLSECKKGKSFPRKPLTEEQKLKLADRMRRMNTGKPSNFKGRKHSEESLAKQRAVKLGKKHTPEAIAKVKATRQRIAIERDDSVRHESFASALEWLKAQGFSKAAYPSLRMACKGLIKQAYGHTWRYAEKETGAEAPV